MDTNATIVKGPYFLNLLKNLLNNNDNRIYGQYMNIINIFCNNDIKSKFKCSDIPGYRKYVAYNNN